MSVRDFERDKKMAAAYRSGKTLAAVGAEFGGISRERVRKILERVGEPRRVPGWEQRAKLPEIRRLLKEGIPNADIAKSMGVSWRFIGRHFPHAQKQGRAEKIRIAKKLYKKHGNCYVVGEIMGLSDMTVWKWLSELGLIRKPKRYTAKQKQQAVDLVTKKGWTLKRVAKKYDCSRDTVRRWVHETKGCRRDRSSEAKLHMQRRRTRMEKARALREEKLRAVKVVPCPP